MNTTTNVADEIARAKASLARDFPDWNIVRSNADRWWAFLDPNRRPKEKAAARTTAVDADTSEELYALLTEVEGPATRGMMPDER